MKSMKTQKCLKLLYKLNLSSSKDPGKTQGSVIFLLDLSCYVLGDDVFHLHSRLWICRQKFSDPLPNPALLIIQMKSEHIYKAMKFVITRFQNQHFFKQNASTTTIPNSWLKRKCNLQIVSSLFAQ